MVKVLGQNLGGTVAMVPSGKKPEGVVAHPTTLHVCWLLRQQLSHMVVAQHVRSMWSCWASPHTSQEVLWRLWLLAAVVEAIPE